MKTIKPMTLPEPHPEFPVHAGEPTAYFWYTPTRVTENHAPKAVAIHPPIKETRKHMSVLFSNIDDCLQHQDREGYPGPPADEAEDVKDREDKEDDSTNVVLPSDHGHCCDQANDDLEYERDPDELLGEGPGSPHISVAEYQCNHKHEGEQDDRIAGKTEL